MRRALPLIALALAVSACGSKSRPAGPEGGAAVAPSTSAAIVRVNTSPGSDQWQALRPVALLLPGAAETLARVEALGDALGPETDAVALDAAALRTGATVGLTQSPNPGKLQGLLKRNDPPLVTEEVADWNVIAQDRRTIDRFKRERNEGSLASDGDYQDATEGLPSPALAGYYVDGTALTAALDERLKTGSGPVPGLGRVSWFAGTVTAQPDALAVRARLKGDELEVSNHTAELPAVVPAPVSLLVDEKGLDATLDEVKRAPGLAKRLGTIGTLLGTGLLDDVVGLFRGEAVLYLRPLPGAPEYTLVLKIEDEDRANEVLDRLTTLAGAASQDLPTHPRIEGVLATRLTVAKRAYYYAVFDGKLVVTTRPSGIRGLVRGGTRLVDTPGWQAAAQASGLPDETAGIVYTDLGKTLPMIQTLLGEKPAQGLVPLGESMYWASVEGSVLTVSGSASVR